MNLKTTLTCALGAASISALAAAPAGALKDSGTGTTPCAGGHGNVTWSPAVLWPANHKLRTITINWTEPADGGSNDTNTLTVTGITSVGVDDKGSGQPSAKQGPDYAGVGNSASGADGQQITVTAQVRAERSGTDKAGRTYKIDLSCNSSDDSNGSAEAVVTVPHDMGNGSGSSSGGSGSGGGKGSHGPSAHAPSVHLPVSLF